MASQPPPATQPLATQPSATQPSATQPISSFKRIIVCCDGTWEAGDHASKGDDSTYQTNITRMCRALADFATMPDGTRVHQIVYYQSGVGANVPTALGRAFAGAVGYGVNENILSAYNFLVNNYNEGDELFFFGFSRGSFTCRSLAGMISQLGILRQEAAAKWFTGIWGRYQGTDNNTTWERKKAQLTHDVTIKVIGCWDTVGSLGIPETTFTKILNLNHKYAFHDTELSDKIENAYHALALDEHRKSFSPTLWYLPPKHDTERRTSLKQCWFAGVHTDVGRGYEDHVPSDIADITFAWMVHQCRDHLAFNESEVRKMLKKGDFKKPRGAEAERERAERVRKAEHWGLADLHNSMDTLLFKIGGSRTRTPGRYIFKMKPLDYQRKPGSSSRSPSEGSFVTDSTIVTNATPEEKSWYWRFWEAVSGVIGGRPEDIAHLAPVWTSEVIHPSVRVRMWHDRKYDPPALRGFKLYYSDSRDRWTWIKTWTANGEVRIKKLREHAPEGPAVALGKINAEMLRYRVGEEVPLPPREHNSWFWFW